MPTPEIPRWQLSGMDPVSEVGDEHMRWQAMLSRTLAGILLTATFPCERIRGWW